MLEELLMKTSWIVTDNKVINGFMNIITNTVQKYSLQSL